MPVITTTFFKKKKKEKKKIDLTSTSAVSTDKYFSVISTSDFHLKYL